MYDKDRYIADLEWDIQVLRNKLHTVERLRAKEMAITPILSIDIYLCVACYEELLREYKYCPGCGHKIEWRIDLWR